MYEKQLIEVKKQLSATVTKVAKLKKELDKRKNVLQQKVMRGKLDILATVQVRIWETTMFFRLN